MPAHPLGHQHGQGCWLGMGPLFVAMSGLPGDLHHWTLAAPLHMFMGIGGQGGFRLGWALCRNSDLVSFGSGYHPGNVGWGLPLLPAHQMMSNMRLLEFDGLQCDIPQSYPFDQPDYFMLCRWLDYIMFCHRHFPFIVDLIIHMVVTARR